jgi:hypothetical protein
MLITNYVLGNTYTHAQAKLLHVTVLKNIQFVCERLALYANPGELSTAVVMAVLGDYMELVVPHKYLEINM